MLPDPGPASHCRNVARALGGDPLPYVWVPEWHKCGHGLHLHFAVGASFLMG